MQLKFGWAAALGLALAGCGGGGGSESTPSTPQERQEAAGIVDTSFGTQGVVTLRASQAQTGSAVREIVSLADGKYLVGGSGPYIARLMHDGSLDSSFASGGIDSTRRGTRIFQDVVKVRPLDDGRAIVVENHSDPCIVPPFFCGTYTFGDVVARRIDANGAPDLSYGAQGLGRADYSQGSIVVSPAGRVASFAIRPSAGTAASQFGVGALDASGARDSAFETRATTAVNSCDRAFDPAASNIQSVAAAQAGERIVVAARWTRSDALTLVCVTRLNADGGLDASFGLAGHQTFMSIPPNDILRSSLAPFRVLVRDDGGIVVALSPPVNSGSLDPPAFLFMTATGAKDPPVGTAMNLTPIVLVSQMSDLVVQPNGKVVGVGLSSAPGVPAPPLLLDTGKVFRSSPFVTIYDAGFGPVRGGYANLAIAGLFMVPQRVVIGVDGAILVGGWPSTGGDSMLMRFR